MINQNTVFGAVFVGPFLSFVFRVFVICLVCSLQPCGHLLGKG